MKLTKTFFGRASLIGALAIGFSAASISWAAEGKAGLGGSSEGALVAAIVLLLVVGRGLGEILQRFGQPAVMGPLIGGILLGPTLFGWVWPSAERLIFSGDPMQKAMIGAVSQLGILLLLLLTGMETDLKLVRRVGAACLSISVTGVIVPFACGFVLAQFLPASLLPEAGERLVAGLFLGTALSISSVKIVAMVVREMNFMRRDLGQIIVSSAIIEDTIGWVIIAVTFGIATNGTFELVPFLTTLVEVALFMVISFTIGRRIVFTSIRWANDTLRSEYAVITTILVIMGVMALITDLIGVHTVLGAFVAGILVGESPILTDHIEGQLRGVITALFMPVFFGVAGLSADLTVLVDPSLALLTVGLVVIASIGKFSGAFIGGKLARMNWQEAVAVGCGMNARGSTEVIVASIGLSMNILSPNLFTMIVTMAVITTLAMPPMLRWALGRLPLREEEKERVDREALDQRGFISNLQRLLVAVDNSPTGKFAAYLAGLIGGSSGKPTTVLHLGEAPKDGIVNTSAERNLKSLRKGAKASAEAVARIEEVTVEKVELTTRDKGPVTGDTIAEEARKGYDIFVVGMENAVSKDGALAAGLSDITKDFEGHLCLVVQGGGSKGGMPLLNEDATILVPVNGTDVSRRAAELALAMARPHGSRVRALYVTRDEKAKRRESLSHRHEEAVLKDVAELAERYGVPIETEIQTRTAAGKAISQSAANGAAVVVMGVTQRPGDDLFFGATATAVLVDCRMPIVLVAGERVKRDDIEKESRRSGKADAQDQRAASAD